MAERISRRRLLRLGYLAAGAAGVSIVLEACKGKGKKVENPKPKTTPTTPPETPIPTATLEPTPTVVPTEVPTAEPETILTPEEITSLTGEALKAIPGAADGVEILLSAPYEISTEDGKKTIAQAVDGAFSAMTDVPQAQDIIDALLSVRSGAENYYVSLNDNNMAIPPINSYGQAGKILIGLACANPSNEKLGQAALSIRSFVKQYSSEHEAAGYLDKGATDVYLNLYFAVPSNCSHPLLQSK